MIDRFDAWLNDEGPVALAIREPLIPVTGRDGIFFPPTFAPDKDDEEKKSTYVIDHGVCLVDSVGSQANRMEPLFLRREYAGLVPQVTVKVGDRDVNLLNAGHRAADAIVRFSGLWRDLREAFLAVRERGEAEKLARIAPTSLVFGAWDSRDTQAKVPRLVESTIRAYGVVELNRAAQYVSSIEEDTREAEGITAEALNDRKFPAAVGLVDNPSGLSHGGVCARDGIRRDAVLNLVALRSLKSHTDEQSLTLQRYILGLSLICFLAPMSLYLRQGCLLTRDPENPAQAQAVYRDGHREDLGIPPETVTGYATEAAQAFGVRDRIETGFDTGEVKKQAKEKKDKKDKKETKK